MAELADALDLGSSEAIRAGSSPVWRTNIKIKLGTLSYQVFLIKNIIFAPLTTLLEELVEQIKHFLMKISS